jgi:hypothetical protein
MNASLSVEDPLADVPVTIVIQLPAGREPQAERAALLALGVEGEPPVFKCGRLANVAALVEQAWLEYGLRRELAVALVKPGDGEVVEAAEAVVRPGIEPVPSRLAQPPRPQPQNLSLF